jgi:hypothetical protein
MPQKSEKGVLDTIRLDVKARGLQAVARELNVPRTSLASALIGAARRGTVLRIVQAAAMASDERDGAA